MQAINFEKDELPSTDAGKAGFQIDGHIMRYHMFVSRLYNWCKTLGFEAGKIMPSRAFCSDESQGYPTIMIAKHFGAFPFNHGRVGGIVATNRHGPHAAHGQDLMIIQASHIGYDPDTHEFGTYRRAQTAESTCSSSCGKVYQVIGFYGDEYRFAQNNILLHNHNGEKVVIVDNQLLREERQQGLLLHLNKVIEGYRVPLKILSTAKVFAPSNYLLDKMEDQAFHGDKPTQIANKLTEDMFYFKCKITGAEGSGHHLEQNLIAHMPTIVTSKIPLLTASQINTQVEFDNTYRSIVKEQAYKGKRLVFIAGLNIDISPNVDQLFPMTKFVPWAAYVQDQNDNYFTLEQDELVRTLYEQSTENNEEVNLELAFELMTKTEEFNLKH